MNQKGKLVVFEGSDGVGKTTQVQLLVEYLQDQGHSTVTFREPGGTEAGQQIRQILLGDSTLDPTAELLLFYASRVQLMMTKTIPLLEQGVTVIMDRFLDSTYAYQGKGRGLLDKLDTIELFRGLEQLVESRVRIDHVLYLFAPAETLLERLKGRTDLNHLDEVDAFFKKRIDEGYIQRMRERQMKSENRRDAFPVIEAFGTVDQVHARVRAWADKHILNLS
jgi:dTMP kinase